MQSLLSLFHCLRSGEKSYHLIIINCIKMKQFETERVEIQCLGKEGLTIKEIAEKVGVSQTGQEVEKDVKSF